VQKRVVYSFGLLASAAVFFFIFPSIKETYLSFNLGVLQVLGTKDIKRKTLLTQLFSSVPSLDSLLLVNFLGRLMAGIPRFFDHHF